MSANASSPITADAAPATVCAHCGVPAELKCAGCKLVAYCGRDHQKLHWKRDHKANCKCYKIVTSALLGRHMIATRPIRRGELILHESPIVAGPKLASEPMCLGCNRRLPVDFHQCSGCRWPMCDARCERHPAHTAECAVIGRAGQPCPIAGGAQIAAGYSVIVPLRCLLLRDARPASYATLLALEDHLAERQRTPVYGVLRANLVSYVQQVLGWTHIDAEHIMRIAAILDTNCFEIRPAGLGTKVRAIFPLTAMFSHDCVPNTRHVFDARMRISVLATVDIPAGALITVTYTQLLKSTGERREHLWHAKCFRCVCARCADPTELGTHCGSIRCGRCRQGFIVSDDPLANEPAGWHCDACDHRMTAKMMDQGNRMVRREIDALDRRSPEAFERFLRQYEETLHERNTHVVQVKYALIQLYGNVDGFRLHELNDAALNRKIALCNELLELAERFEPGATLFRGKILLDLQQAVALKAKREFNGGLLTRAGAQEQLGESLALLQEAVDILRVEPDMPPVLDERMRALCDELE